MTSYLLSGQYSVEVESSFYRNSCVGTYTIMIEGDAGPFSYRMYDRSGVVLEEDSDLEPDVYTITNVAQNISDGVSIEVFDAYGCSCVFENLVFDCDCDDIEPHVIIEQEPCNDNGGSLSVPAMSYLFTAQSVEWIDMDMYIDSPDQRLVENLPAGEYCGLFTFTTSLFTQGSTMDCKDILHCFEILPCLCKDYQPIETIVDATEGLSDGSISLELTYGAPADFRWDNGMVGTSITGLEAGTYTVTITGTASCAIPMTYIYDVEQKCNLLISGHPDAIRNPICNSDNGSIKFNLSDPSDFDIAFGDPPYDWELTNVRTSEIIDGSLTYGWSGLDSRNYLNLTSDDYSLQITDSNGCTDDMIISLREDEDAEILQVLSESIVASCTGMDNGMVELYISSSSTFTGIDVILNNGLSEKIEGSNGSVKFENLLPGRYSADIIDFQTGCSIIENFNISEQEIIPFDRNYEGDVIIKKYCRNTGVPGILQQNLIGNAPFTYDPPDFLTNMNGTWGNYSITDHCGTVVRPYSNNYFTRCELVGCCELTYYERGSKIIDPTPGNNDGYIWIDTSPAPGTRPTCQEGTTIEWISPPLGFANPIQNLSEGVYDFELRNGECYDRFSVVLNNCSHLTSKWEVNFLEIESSTFRCDYQEYSISFDIDSGKEEEDVQIIYKDLSGNTLLVQDKIIRKRDKYVLDLKTEFSTGPIQIFALFDCEVKFVKELNFGCNDCGYDPALSPNYPVWFELDQPCGHFGGLNSSEMHVKFRLSEYGDYVVRYIGEENFNNSLTVYIRVDENGVYHNGDEHQEFHRNSNHYVGIIVYDLNLGCEYVIQKLVGPSQTNCIAPHLKIRDFVNSTVRWQDNESVMAGVEKVRSCGEAIQEKIRFDQFDFYPFDAENPCDGGGIVKMDCNRTLDFFSQSYFSLDEIVYVIPPCTYNEQFTSYKTYLDHISEREYFNCYSSDSKLCIFDLDDKKYPFVLEVCSANNTEVIQPEGFEECKSNNGIVYAVPGASEGCNFDIFCIKRDEYGNILCDEPEFIENTIIEQCCIQKRDNYSASNPNSQCIKKCNCDLEYYSGFSSDDVYCNLVVDNFPDCNSLFFVSSTEYVECSKYKFEFFVPKNDSEVRIVFHRGFISCTEPITVPPVWQQRFSIDAEEDFDKGEHDWDINIPDIMEAGEYTVIIFYNGMPEECFQFNYDCVPSVGDPEGCELELSATDREDELGVTFNGFRNKSLSRPSVILGPLSYNDEDPTSMRVTEVTDQGFKMKMEEWGYQDGVHGSENVSYQYAAPGNYDFGGLKSEVGNVDNINHNYQWVYFKEPFKTVPVVLVTQTSNNSESPSTVRVERVTTTRFRVKLQKEQLSPTLDTQEESISYMAFEQGTGIINERKMVVVKTNRSLNHNWKKIDFGLDVGGVSFSEPPLVLASLQSNYGNETATLRYRNLTSYSMEIRAQEETSADSEVKHSTQFLGYVLIESSKDCCQEGDISFQDAQVFHGTCNQHNGAIYLAASGGHPPYNYEWSSGETSSNIVDLTKGKYVVTVTDDNGCTASETYDIERNSGLNLDKSIVKHPSCLADKGSIEIIAYTGVPPYSYQWSDGNTSNVRTGLADGSYRVTVTDVNGCDKSKSFRLRTVNLYEGYDVFPSFCNANNGLIAGGAYGGTPPYTYNWEDGTTMPERHDLSSGSYYLTVTDADGCSSTRRFNVSVDNSITLDAYGGNEGFSGGRYIPAGVKIDWTFNPYYVSDKLVVSSDSEGVIINTGKITNGQNSCCGVQNCCSDIFMGNHPGKTIIMEVGSGYVTPGSTNSLGCHTALHIGGEFTTKTAGYISIDVEGSMCGGSTGWNLALTCNGTSKRLVEEMNNDFESDNIEDLLSSQVEFNSESNIKVYPNPASETVNINIGIDNKKYNVTLTDINGRMIISEDFNSIESEMNLKSISSGVYILKVDIAGENSYYQKLIIN